jgi:hypothetical protein
MYIRINERVQPDDIFGLTTRPRIKTTVELGQPPDKPAGVKVKHFICEASGGRNEKAEIERVVGRSVTIEELRMALGQAVQHAVASLKIAADGLQRSHRTAETNRLFCEAFGTAPTHIPKWRPPGKTWNRGDVVRARLLYAAKILGGGSIRYFCWNGRLHCDPNCLPSENHFACFGRYRICLGSGFWEAFRDKDLDTMASTLIHEALHIYFEGLVMHGERGGRHGNAVCYERFVMTFNKLRLHPSTNTECLSFPEKCRESPLRTRKASESVPTSYLYDSSLGDDSNTQKVRGLNSTETDEVKKIAEKLQRRILELEKRRAITSEEAREYLSWAKHLFTEVDRLGKSQKATRSAAKELRRKSVAFLQDARKYKRFPDFLLERAEKKRSTKGLKLISRFNISPAVIRVHENEAVRISFIVSDDISSIDCSILSPEKQGPEAPPPNYRFFKMQPIPGYHFVIWDGTFTGSGNKPPVTGTYRIRIKTKDKRGREEEIFDQISVLNPHKKTVLPRTGSGLALDSLHFDGAHAVLTDVKGNKIRVRAVSGLKLNHRLNPGKVDFTKSNFQWEEDKGPLPESKDVPGGKYIIRKNSVQHPVVKDGALRYPSGDKRGGTVEAWGAIRVPLHPFTITKGSKIRNEFFVHIDTKNDGTAGCIGVHPDDAGKFNQIMSLIALMPNDELPVIVEYTR